MSAPHALLLLVAHVPTPHALHALQHRTPWGGHARACLARHALPQPRRSRTAPSLPAPHPLPTCSTQVGIGNLKVGDSRISLNQLAPVRQSVNSLAEVNCAPSAREQGYKCIAGLMASLQHSSSITNTEGWSIDNRIGFKTKISAFVLAEMEASFNFGWDWSKGTGATESEAYQTKVTASMDIAGNNAECGQAQLMLDVGETDGTAGGAPQAWHGSFSPHWLDACVCVPHDTAPPPNVPLTTPPRPHTPANPCRRVL